jgi:hypothetical protein
MQLTKVSGYKSVKCRVNQNRNLKLNNMWYLKDVSTGKYLTLYGMVIGFTDNLEIARSFESEAEAVQFEDDYSNDFKEYTEPVFIENLNN